MSTSILAVLLLSAGLAAAIPHRLDRGRPLLPQPHITGAYSFNSPCGIFDFPERIRKGFFIVTRSDAEPTTEICNVTVSGVTVTPTLPGNNSFSGSINFDLARDCSAPLNIGSRVTQPFSGFCVEKGVDPEFSSGYVINTITPAVATCENAPTNAAPLQCNCGPSAPYFNVASGECLDAYVPGSVLCSDFAGAVKISCQEELDSVWISRDLALLVDN